MIEDTFLIALIMFWIYIIISQYDYTLYSFTFLISQIVLVCLQSTLVLSFT